MEESPRATGPRRAGRRGRSLEPQGPPFTLDVMRQSIAEILGSSPTTFGDEDDLIYHGLDSISVMRLVNTWRRHGVELKFAELIERPTLAEWWRLASARLRAKREAHEEVRVDESAPFDLAPMQQAYWIGVAEGQALGAVDAQYYVEFDGEGVETERLERAVRALTDRHPMLRARFLPDGRQQIMAVSSWEGVRVHDLGELSGESARRALDDLRRDLSHRRMAVHRGEVFDVRLTRLPGGATRIHLNMNMLVCDARSFQVVLGELAQLYRRPERALPAVGYSFPRYLAERARRRASGLAQAKAYWQGRLPALPGAPHLPLATNPDRVPEQKVGRRHDWMPPEASQRLARRCREQGLTVPAVLATVFAETIGAWSAEPRFLLNMPLFDREELHPDAGRVVGDFSNLIILAVELDPDLSFCDQARRLHARLVEDVAHAEYSGLEVLRDLARDHPGGGMMAPVVFTSAVGLGDLYDEEVRGCFGTPGFTTSQTPQVWLDCQVTERDGGLLFNWDVVESLFPDGLIDAMFAFYVRLLSSLASPGSDWGEALLETLPRSQAEVRASINAPHGPSPARRLHELFFEHARAAPERLALAWGDNGRMTYGDLARRALSISARLLERGVGPGDAVAVTMAQSASQVAAVLGALAAGAAYVPVSPSQPACRRSQIYRDARARWVLAGAAEADSLDQSSSPEVIVVECAHACPPLEAPRPISPEALAYIIYTSGSSGGAKGVEMSHRAAMNTILDVNRRFGVGQTDRTLAVSSLEFDLSVYDLFGLLSAGGSVVLVDEEMRREAGRWVELAGHWGVTVWNSVPALLDMFLIAAEARDQALNLRLALLSGDWIGTDLPGRLEARCPGCRFVALGGATEAGIWSNALEVRRVDPSWKSIPYGFPLANQRYRVVDERGRDRPDFVPGELWIGGDSLGEGYRGDPERTADRFVTRGGERWYRTGDQGRYWPDGALEFLGRADSQVKIRGHRIELGEVAAALEAHPQVARAVAIVAGKGGSRIAAAVVARAGELDESTLRAFAGDRLPTYMVPDRILIVADLPLTANGKVDRKVLGDLASEAEVASDGEPPQGPVETALVGLWSELLGIGAVGRRQSFLASGGDSLTATRLLEAIRTRFGVEIPLRQFLLTPTVAELSRLIEQADVGVEEGII